MYTHTIMTARGHHGRSHPWQRSCGRELLSKASELKGLPRLSRASTPKPESVCFTVSWLSPTPLTLTGGLAEAWSPRVSSSIFLSLSLPLPLFFRLIPWSMGAPCAHLSAQVSKTWTGRRSVSSLPQETGRAPVASMNRENFLSWSFIGSLCKPRNISRFLSSIFLSTTFNRNRRRRFSFGFPWILQGLDPGGMVWAPMRI